MTDQPETSESSESAPKVSKASHVGAPAIFALELECKHLGKAFGSHCYLVGSALERADWRDVDVRLIMPDDEFKALFPKVNLTNSAATWEFDHRWLIMTTAISERLSRVTGLPIDFQFQPRTHANNMHKKGRRDALGMNLSD